MKRNIIILFVLFVLIACFYMNTSHGFTKEVIVAEGLIEVVSWNSIQVKGKTFNISDALIKDNVGRDVAKNELKRGRYVYIKPYAGKLIVMIDMTE